MVVHVHKKFKKKNYKSGEFKNAKITVTTFSRLTI